MPDPMDFADPTAIHERTLRVQGVDPDAGTFGMTLATEGEGSDGHILSIEGGSLPSRMPLLVSHWNDPKETAGSVVRARKHLSETPPRISAVGEIELGGDGVPADIRRDLMFMIARGHVGAVSIRWDASDKDATRRIELPADHPYYVNPEKEPFSSRKRWGYFFRKWRALEGSIVALGADPLALIGRANETQEPVATFWRSFAADAQPAAEPPPEPKPVEPAALVAAFAAQVREMIARGVVFDELAAALNENKPEAPLDTAALVERIQELETRIQLSENRRVFGEPSAPLSGSGLLSGLRELLAQDRSEGMAKFRALIEEQRGKVTA